MKKRAAIMGEYLWLLIAGLLTDLAIAFIIIGICYDVPALIWIGSVGFFLACTPAAMAAPLMWAFGLYLAAIPPFLLFKHVWYTLTRKE